MTIFEFILLSFLILGGLLVMPYVIVRIWARLSPAPRWSDFFPELSEKEGGGKDHDYEEINELMIGLDTSPRHNPDDDAPKFIAAVMTDRG